MPATLLTLVYTAICAFIAASAYNMVMLNARRQQHCGDRTGLIMTHPELLDEHGFLTKEQLLTVRFSEFGNDSRPSFS